MKNLVTILAILAILASCGSSYKTAEPSQTETNVVDNDTLRIKSDKVEYEIIIIEPGFNNWMRGRARPRGYYTQSFLESRNRVYVVEWNNRVLDPFRYDPQLYEMQINYEHGIDYGYEVNYLLYYYFIYFQRTYKQRLAGWVPRI
ncbi:MAG: hypothetical protein HKO67_05355 [Flavobacteriaceae bacterium]|nr:hypothetical protein [Flavobacteriaceae bacterium]